MKIQVIPSVDILNGKVVRLFQGQYNKVTEYSKSPKDVVKSFMKHGFNFIHIVNLDGAKSEHNTLTENIIEEIISMGCQIQIGGGIRSFETAQNYVNLGAKVVLGTICVKNPTLTKEIIDKMGVKNVTLAFDCKENNGIYEVMVNGWEEGNNTPINTMLDTYSAYKINIICTDISVDGTLTAPNFSLYKWIKKHYPQFALQASGGVSCIEDIQTLQAENINSVIVGRAIHHGMISMQELSSL